MAKKGRPLGSNVRDRIINILYQYRNLHGYGIHKVYEDIFGDVSRRLIYYHLDKGVEIGSVELAGTKEEEGNYSWGDTVQQKHYRLGPNAEPSYDERIAAYKEENDS
jgi:hypothetical protein